METYPASTVSRTFMQVLEDFAFLFGEPVEAGSTPVTTGPYLQATMGFKGPFEGTLMLAAPEAFGVQVAANVLGLDAEQPEAGQGAIDALKELLNVTCGCMLIALAGNEPVFDLTIPEVTRVTADEWAATPELPETAGFLVEDLPVFLQFRVRDAVRSSEC